MVSKKTGKAASKSAAGKHVSKAKRTGAAQVYEQIAHSVRTSAVAIAEKLIEKAKNGDAAAAKYLFELAEIFPAPTDANAGEKEEDSLAKTLMHRLNLPEEPIKLDEGEDGETEATEQDDDVASKSEMQDQR